MTAATAPHDYRSRLAAKGIRPVVIERTIAKREPGHLVDRLGKFHVVQADGSLARDG